MSTFFVIADDVIVYRCDDGDEARGYAAAYTEHVGEDAKAYRVELVPELTEADRKAKYEWAVETHRLTAEERAAILQRAGLPMKGGAE